MAESVEQRAPRYVDFLEKLLCGQVHISASIGRTGKNDLLN